MQAKSTLKFPLPTVRMAIINTTNDRKDQGGREERGTIIHCSGSAGTREISERFLSELERDLTYDPAILLLSISGVFSQQLHILLQRWLFICLHCCSIQKKKTTKWIKFRYPSTHEWVMKIWRIYVIEFYPAIRKNEF